MYVLLERITVAKLVERHSSVVYLSNISYVIVITQNV